MKRRTLLYSLGVAIVLVIGLAYAAYWFRLTQIKRNCVDEAHIIPSGRPNLYVSVVDTTCDFLGGSEQVKIDLVSKDIFRHTTHVFVYDPDSINRSPVVRWRDAATLEITATGITHIIKKETDVHGVKVIYHLSGV